MSRITQVVTLIAVLAAVPATAAEQGSENANGQRGRYQEQDRATSTTFAATTDAAGNAVLTLKGGDFVLEKVVAHTGDTTLRLSQGKDVVTVALSQGGFQVARGRKSLRIDPRADTQDTFDGVRAMLTGSQAIRSFKRLVAALEQRDESEEDTPLAISAMIDGAVIYLLDGDPEAPLRLAKRISRKHTAGIRAISAKRLPGVYVDCIGLYEGALMSAWNQFQGCAYESSAYSWWSRDLVYNLCSWEWAIRSNQYIWQFIGCFMVPW
jgi:hypothetical protein